MAKGPRSYPKPQPIPSTYSKPKPIQPKTPRLPVKGGMKGGRGGGY
jgi:hypothetical protein